MILNWMAIELNLLRSLSKVEGVEAGVIEEEGAEVGVEEEGMVMMLLDVEVDSGQDLPMIVTVEGRELPIQRGEDDLELRRRRGQGLLKKGK